MLQEDIKMNNIISEIIKDFYKPYLVCICNNFIEGDQMHDRKMYICNNCGGRISLKRIVDRLE